MKKRALSFFLMLIMVFALLPTSAYAKYTYDPAKAIAWATNKTEFDKYSEKCAAFVSRCLREGGLKDVSYSEPGAMVSFLEKSDYGTTYRINDANLKKLKAGDVVMVYCGKGHDKSKYWGLHTIFVTAVDQKNKKFTYCAKNESRFCVTKTFGYLKNYASYIKCNRCGSSSNSVGVFVSMNTTSQTPKQKYTLLFDGNSGSGSMSNQVVTMGDKFALPSCTFTREGYRCIGWNVCRNADKTWYVAKHGWLTQQQITEQKLEKKLYANDSSAQYVFDSSWTQGCSTVSTYTFHAVWEQLPHEHNYVRQERPATCTQDGYVKYVCACGSSYNEAVYPALGHDWDSGTVTKQPTATETGVRTYTCTRCGETKTESIPVISVDVTQMFTDVTKNWAYPGIQYCVTHGIMGGMGDGTFAPTGTTTRAQIVQILYNLEGTPAVSGTTPFTDLTANWYKPAILWAYQNNVVAGTSPTTFDPEGPVTREQIAVILTQYMFHVLKMERTWTPADLSAFPDGANVSSWAKEAMQDAVALGLINGTKAPDGLVYLDPQGSAARQQVATILMNFCQNVKK